MGKTLLDLAKNLKKRVKNLDEQSNKAAIKVAETVLGDLVRKTPVDTSKAISNWQIGLNAPTNRSLFPYFEGSQGSTFNSSAQAAFSVGKSILSRKKPGQKIYISNALRYISKLDAGSSKQEPAGFVARAVLLGRIQAKKTKIKVR